MKWAVASALAAAVFALVGTIAGVALAAASFLDPVGDTNEAPDVTSVSISERPAGTLSISVAVRNFETLPRDSWINLWFDLDSNEATGDGGDEALVRYLFDGTVEFFHWNGDSLASAPPAGMTATYSAGVLTLEVTKTALDDAASFGILAVASREQQVEGEANIAADFAPDSGRSSYVGPGPVAFPDPEGDQPSAPDVTSVRVADAKNGTISFAISTPNFPTLPPEMLVLLLVDRDGKMSTGLAGADILVLYQDGEAQIGRWNRSEQQFLADDPPSRVRARNAGGVLTFLVHRSELDDPTRFRFAVGAGHVSPDDGDFDALDIAPESLFWQYTMTNKPAMRLVAGKTSGAPVRPVAGKTFAVTVPVTRSDTGRRIAAGSVTCSVTVGGQKVPATGRVGTGGARCAFRVPGSASGKRVTGSVLVRSGGKTVTARFAYSVR
jgi:hypothetical protein